MANARNSDTKGNAGLERRPMTNSEIFIVDDDYDMREALSAIFRKKATAPPPLPMADPSFASDAIKPPLASSSICVCPAPPGSMCSRSSTPGTTPRPFSSSPHKKTCSTSCRRCAAAPSTISKSGSTPTASSHASSKRSSVEAASRARRCARRCRRGDPRLLSAHAP